MDDNRSPNFPVEMPGRAALSVASQARVAGEAHDQWHRDHPGEMCKPGQFADNYADLELGDRLMDGIGGYFNAGDALLGRK